MLTKTKTPPLVSLTGNPIRFTLQSDNAQESSGLESMVTITFSDTAQSETDTFQLLYGSVDILFTFSDAPDGSGTQLPTKNVIANLSDWIAAVGDALLMNYFILRDWDITVGSDYLRLTGKPSNVSSPVASFQWSGAGTNPTILIQNGTESKPRDFFKIGLQLLLKIGSTFTQIGEDVLPVDSSAKATFDIHSLFADYLYPEFKYPEASNQLAILRSKSSAEFKIRYFERYGNPITPGALTTSESFFALIGGVSTLQQAIYNRQASSFWAKLGYNQYFLTWAPTSKMVERYSTEKLFYLVRSSITSLKLMVEVTYNDGTALSLITKASIPTPTLYGVYEISCSPNVLQLPGYDTGIIASYRVWMEDQSSNRISEIRTFILDYKTREITRQFLFLNSIGGFDTLRITGEVTDDLSLERTSIAKILGDDFTEFDHQQSTSKVIETRVHKANTGWKSREDIAWIRDFLLSKQVYQMNVGKLVPITITSSQAHQYTDREDLFSIDFEYQRAYESEHYSKEIVSAEYDTDFNDDFPNQ